ncbi:pyridoxamine 5'-phosphate oxidase family protein [Pseudomonas oryzihabitans]|uniref:General stress protein 26 n=1 Tax=Pseudomonas oryzihabitans TaxID=47885 RepID=A0AAJ2EWP1_9PSED|nr:pyridoxamine 5'-phosphate oxidase family protein [Pseudomonas psychrotolerans]MDR6233591.1 general stress protein 26 [Pseudomonas psychrotolerans]MDR6357359.1 general stress protein 26 [Pseudomonas psychrotolerans]
MADKTLHDLSKAMRDLDFCMLTTGSGRLTSRPMSNNGDVEYDGDSWFYAYEDSAKIRDIEQDPAVGLTFTEGKSLLGKPGLFVAIDGRAELIRDKAQFEAHWTKSLQLWFPQGTDTPGMILIKVQAERVRYWDGEEQGELRP